MNSWDQSRSPIPNNTNLGTVLNGASTQIRVAHLIYGQRQVTGIERMVLELMSRARSHQVHPLLVAFGEDGPVRALAENEGIRVRQLQSARGFSWRMLRELAQVLEEFSVDLLHAHDLGPWLNAALCKVFRPRIRVLVTFHEVRLPEGRKRAAAAVAARLSSAVVACGTEVRRQLESWVPRGTQVITIPNGVVVPDQLHGEGRQHARLLLGLPPEAVAIGYLGRMDEEKQPELLLDVFRERFLGRKDVHLVFIGGGPLEQSLRIRAAKENNIHVMGEIVVGAPSLLLGLDIYAQPSRREGRSMAMLEAMAAGLPTVAYDLAAIREMHVQNETALLVASGDRGAFGFALERLANDPALRGKLAEAARTLCGRYSVDQMVSQYTAVYRRHFSRPAA